MKLESPLDRSPLRLPFLQLCPKRVRPLPNPSLPSSPLLGDAKHGGNWGERARAKEVKLGTIMAEVVVDVGGQAVVSAITRGSVERLGLAEGTR